MRWRGQRESRNVEDIRGKRARRAGFGLGTIALLMVGTYLLGGNPINTFTSLNRAGYVNLNPGMSSSAVQSGKLDHGNICLLYTSPSPRDATLSRMPSSA